MRPERNRNVREADEERATKGNRFKYARGLIWGWGPTGNKGQSTGDVFIWQITKVKGTSSITISWRPSRWNKKEHVPSNGLKGAFDVNIWVVMGSHHSLSFTVKLGIPVGSYKWTKEPMWGSWWGHRGCPILQSLCLQKGRIWSAGGRDGVNEGRANPLNQPDSTESTLQGNAISNVSLTSCFCVYVIWEPLAVPSPHGCGHSDSFVFVPTCVSWLNGKPKNPFMAFSPFLS